jgi:predicted ribosome quality control (RQC) complex YloA/Tae2 family protein
LSRLGFELSKELIGSLIADSYTAEKEKLTLKLINDEEFYLDFCVNHTLPFIQKRYTISHKKKNTKKIFPELLNLKFSNVFIAKNDRVVLFLIENEISLFFAVRGKFTNLYLLNNDKLTSFKKIDEEDLEKIKDEFLSLDFTHPLTLPELSLNDDISFNELKKRYPFVTSDIISVSDDNARLTKHEIEQSIKRVFYDNLFLTIDNKNKTLEINITKKQDESTNVKEFSSAIELVSEFLFLSKQFDNFKRLHSYLSKYIQKELTSLNKKKESLIEKINIGSKEDHYRKLADLLLINKSKLATGMEEIILEDIYSNGCEIRVALNKKLSPQENIEHYFKKAKEEKIFFERSGMILAETEKRISSLSESINKLNNSQTIEELIEIMKNLGLKMKQNENEKKEVKLRFRQFLIDNKYKVYVGKDSQSNDELTLRFAKQNDYWFHARSVSGSHVVLRVDNKNEAIPKSVLKKVASIAAYYSKAKTSSLVPVSFTLKKYVIKKKGMNVGQVALLKEETLLVKPEIPSDAATVDIEN